MRNFAAIIRSPDPVRRAFSSYQPAAFVWWIILKLHGPIVENNISEQETREIIAQGFHFYGILYRILSFSMASLAIILYCFSFSQYVILGSFVASIYLWFATGLCFSGAKSYSAQKQEATTLLITFLQMITIFLSVLLVVISLSLEQTNLIPSFWNLTLCTLIFLFGVGSYTLEIVYLITSAQTPS